MGSLNGSEKKSALALMQDDSPAFYAAIDEAAHKLIDGKYTALAVKPETCYWVEKRRDEIRAEMGLPPSDDES